MKKKNLKKEDVEQIFEMGIFFWDKQKKGSMTIFGMEGLVF